VLAQIGLVLVGLVVTFFNKNFDNRKATLALKLADRQPPTLSSNIHIATISRSAV